MMPKYAGGITMRYGYFDHKNENDLHANTLPELSGPSCN